MHDDSDFFMTVWDPVNKCAFETMFATTRGWSYPCFASSVDASDEVMAEYRTWAAEKAEADRQRHLEWKAEREHKLAEELRLNDAQLAKLRTAYPSDEQMEPVRNLLKVKNYHSEFRAKLAKQVRDWIDDPSPRYATPLSLKQQQHL